MSAEEVEKARADGRRELASELLGMLCVHMHPSDLSDVIEFLKEEGAS
jgi:hypothetical protein